MKLKQMKWWHCVAIYLVANLISLLPAGFNGDEAFYNAFKQPGVAPPDWLFAPVWFINNVTSLIGLYIVVNLPVGTRYRREVILLEAISWVLYAVFAFLYFGLKSPILGAIDTGISLILVVLSFSLSYTFSKRAAWAFAPRLVWLLLATYVSWWIVAHNKDLFFN